MHFCCLVLLFNCPLCLFILYWMICFYWLLSLDYGSSFLAFLHISHISKLYLRHCVKEQNNSQSFCSLGYFSEGKSSFLFLLDTIMVTQIPPRTKLNWFWAFSYNYIEFIHDQHPTFCAIIIFRMSLFELEKGGCLEFQWLGWFLHMPVKSPHLWQVCFSV